MNIKKIANTVIQFIIYRVIEILGACSSILGLLLLISLISYSPNDPNFIFPDNTEINNIFGFQGSYISDLFFQSVGIMSYLISFTFILTGINIFRSKDLFLLIDNIFCVVLYSFFGTLFLGYFYQNAFDLYINGNGGFVGQYLNQTFFGDLIKLQSNVSYYFLILLISILFLISINFSTKKLVIFLKKMANFFLGDKSKSYTDKSEIISEYIPQDEIKNLIQDDLPFIKAEKIKESEKLNLNFQV